MTNTLEEVNDNDFVLKHRIAGAAFLLFFGALVLPWLLGSPSQANKPELVEIVQTGESDSTISKDLESEILAELQESLRDEEQVYISKITPAGQANKVTITKVNKSSADSKKADLKLAKEKLAKETLAKQKRAKEALAKEELAKEKLAKSSAKLNNNAATLDAELEKNKAAADLAAALASESTKNATAITKGWVVQVGMFVDTKKADNVFETLRNKGFNPSTSVVDTNKGIGTGTRVWLGPFKERQDALDTKKTLSEKTGSSGFIRAYP